jgi:hypothetical protein
MGGTAFNDAKYGSNIASNRPFVAKTPYSLGTFTATLISPIAVKLVRY